MENISPSILYLQEIKEGCPTCLCRCRLPTEGYVDGWPVVISCLRERSRLCWNSVCTIVIRLVAGWWMYTRLKWSNVASPRTAWGIVVSLDLKIVTIEFERNLGWLILLGKEYEIHKNIKALYRHSFIAAASTLAKGNSHTPIYQSWTVLQEPYSHSHNIRSQQTRN